MTLHNLRVICDIYWIYKRSLFKTSDHSKFFNWSRIIDKTFTNNDEFFKSNEKSKSFCFVFEYKNLIFFLLTQPSLAEALNMTSDDDLEFVRTTDLVEGVKHKIEKFETLKTKYGYKIVAVLDFGTYFLPPRYARIVKKWSANVEDIDCNNLYLSLDGRRDDDYNSPILKFSKE